jgi:hypothetical protein
VTTECMGNLFLRGTRQGCTNDAATLRTSRTGSWSPTDCCPASTTMFAPPRWSPLLAPRCPLPTDPILGVFRSFPWDSSVAAQEVCQNWPVPIIAPASFRDAKAVERTLNNEHILACLIKFVKQADLESATVMPCGCRWLKIPWTRLTASP